MNPTPRAPSALTTEPIEQKELRPLPEIPVRPGLADILPKETEPGSKPEKALPKLYHPISFDAADTDSTLDIKQQLSRSSSGKRQPIVRSPIRVGRGEPKEKSPAKEVWSHRRLSSVPENLPADPVAEFDRVAGDIVPRLARFEMKVPLNRESHAKQLPILKSKKFNPKREKQASETPRLAATRNSLANRSTSFSPRLKEVECSADQKLETPSPLGTETPDGLDSSRVNFFRAEEESESARASRVPPETTPGSNEGELTVLYRGRRARDDVDEWLDSYLDELKKIIIPTVSKPSSGLEISTENLGETETMLDLEEKNLVPGEASVIRNDGQIEDLTDSKKLPTAEDEFVERSEEFPDEQDKSQETTEQEVGAKKKSKKSEQLMQRTRLSKIKPATPTDLAEKIRLLIERNPGRKMGTIRVLNALLCAAGGTAFINLGQPETRAYIGILSSLPDIQRYDYLRSIFDEMKLFLPPVQRQDIWTSLAILYGEIYTGLKSKDGIKSQLEKIQAIIKEQLSILEDPLASEATDPSGTQTST